MITIHHILNMASILLGFTIFFITWFGNISNNGHRLKVISIAILISSTLSFAYVMSTFGIYPLKYNNDINTLLWVTARLIWSGALLYGLYIPDDDIKAVTETSSYIVVVMLIIVMSCADLWNQSIILNQQAIISALWIAFACDLLALFILRHRRTIYVAGSLIQACMIFDALTNICLIAEVSHLLGENILSHLFKFLSYYYLLLAVFYYLIKNPYQHLTLLKEQMEELATKNATLYKESEQQRNLVEDILAKIGAIISSQLNLKDTLDAIADMVADIMHSRQSIIAMLTSDQSHLQVLASYGITTPPTYLPFDQCLGAQAIAENKSLFIGNLSTRPDIFRPQLIFSSISSLISAPLVNNGQVIGTIEAYSNESDAFTQKDALLLTALGNYAGAAISSAMLYEETKLRLEEERFLSEIAQDASSTIDPKTIMEQCTDHVVEALSADTGLSFLFDTIPNHLNIVASINFNYKISEVKLEDLPKLNSLIKNLKPVTSTADVFPPLAEIYDQNSPRHIMIIPITLDSVLLGVIIVGWQGFVTSERINRLSFASLMAQQIALGLEKARLYNQVKSMALSDGLTGLANRRNFNMFLKTELRRASSLNRPLSLIMFDLDKFKLYNDTYGHLTGDKLLTQIGQILHNTVRSIDLPARFGGDEFSVILPECTSTEAFRLAEAVRKAVESSQFPDNIGTFSAKVTASLGVATYDPGMVLIPLEADRIIAIADKALYQAKQNGRNQVIATTVLE